MLVISSHLLDALGGTHASGVDVELTRINESGLRSMVFMAETDSGGRIRRSLETDLLKPGKELELAFSIGKYFCTRYDLPVESQIVEQAIVRFNTVNDIETYHFPLMISPHSYSIWWPSPKVQ